MKHNRQPIVATGADSGNRNRTNSLEGCGSTIKLHLQTVASLLLPPQLAMEDLLDCLADNKFLLHTKPHFARAPIEWSTHKHLTRVSLATPLKRGWMHVSQISITRAPAQFLGFTTLHLGDTPNSPALQHTSSSRQRSTGLETYTLTHESSPYKTCNTHCYAIHTGG